MLIQKYKKFLFPGFIVILLIIAALFEFIWKDILTFSFALIPLAFAGGRVIYSTICATIHLKKITAGMLVVLALVGTTIFGEYLAGAVVSFMMIFGEFLEELTMKKTRNAVKELIKLVPDTVHKKIGNEYCDRSIKETDVGDIILVKPGERIPVDGTIIKGQAAINESSITGEPIPVDKTVCDDVFVGTLNETGVIEIKTEKIGSDTVLGKIITTIHQAQNKKGTAQKTADRFAEYFLPLIIIICILVGLTVYIISGDADNALNRVITILVIACPCALILATPTAVVASVGNAAKKGVLIKGGITLEKAARIDAICLDKTGTLTEGKPKVTTFLAVNGLSDQELLEKAAFAEKNSQHPLALTILQAAQDRGIDTNAIPAAESFVMLFGRGIRVYDQGVTIEVSNKKVLADAKIIDERILPFIEEQESKGRTCLLTVVDGIVIGGFAISDTIRPEAHEVVNRLHEIGIRRTIILTGDNEATAKNIAQQVGITEYYASLLPEEKLERITKLQDEGLKIAMVGDGINDGPALAMADIGIAMGAAGTDVAIESSDITLMSDNLDLLVGVFQLSREAYGIIKQNIWFFAVFVNVIGVWASGMGWLNPIWAAIIHNASSVFVVVNSSRLLTYKFQNRGKIISTNRK